MDLMITGEVWYWRGPSPFHFVTVGADPSRLIADAAPEVTYGWGMIPVSCRLGATVWTTSLWPKDGAYLIPIKNKVRAAEEIELGDVVTVRLTVDV